MKTISILAYHKIGEPSIKEWQTWNYVSVENFEKHLDYLLRNEYSVIDAKTFLAGLENTDLIPPKALLITFDDGYKSMYDTMLPVLKKFSFPAVLFIPTAYVGNYNVFDADLQYEPKESMCTWDELRELENNKVSIQSHGVFHRHFSDLSPEELDMEISVSKAEIEKEIKKPVQIFSFPYGDDGQNKLRTMELLEKAGYSCAMLYGGGAAKPIIISRFKLPRIAVGSDTDLEAEMKRHLV